MKNKKFFYLQYNKINWTNQEKTKINFHIYRYVINEIILKKKGNNISVFDMGFGIGFFIKMLYHKLTKSYKNITIEGCEPSVKNFNYFSKEKTFKTTEKFSVKTYNSTFLDVLTKTKFDYLTSIYVFPHITSDDIEKTVKKIYSMLKEDGKLILILAEEKYIEKKLKSEKDLFIENNIISYKGKKYNEVLHYSDIPKIGKVIDYNRDKAYYVDLFDKNGFKLVKNKNLNDSGFVCSLFLFQKTK